MDPSGECQICFQYSELVRLISCPCTNANMCQDCSLEIQSDLDANSLRCPFCNFEVEFNPLDDIMSESQEFNYSFLPNLSATPLGTSASDFHPTPVTPVTFGSVFQSPNYIDVFGSNIATPVQQPESPYRPIVSRNRKANTDINTSSIIRRRLFEDN